MPPDIYLDVLRRFVDAFNRRDMDLIDANTKIEEENK